MKKKLIAAFLASIVLCAFAGIGAVAVEEDDSKIVEVLAIIEEYNETHGGTGALSASYKRGKGSTLIWDITGQVTGATKGIAFSNHSIASWDATLIGETNGEPMLRGFTSINFLGGEIKTNGLAVESTSVLISQASISGSEAIRASSISITGGTIVGDVKIVDIGFADFSMSGGVFTGALYCEDGSIRLSENATVNLTALSAKSVHIYDKVRLHFSSNATVTVSGDTYVSIRAKIAGSSAREFIKDATLEYNHIYYSLKHLWTFSVVQFILRWVFFPRAMLGIS